jgi:hypothetical protein
MTPTRPVSVTDNKALTPGSITPHQGDIELVAQGVQGGGRGRVAGHHHQFDGVLFHQLVGDLRGELPHLVEAPRTVGVTSCVAQVNEVLAREEVDQRPGHGQPTETTVEHAYGPVVHVAASLSWRL